MSSSRHVVGLATVWRTAGKPLVTVLAAGMMAKNAWPVGSTATVLFGKVAKVLGTTPGPLDGQSGKPVSGSRVKSVPAAGQRSLKLPPRSASEGTFWLIVVEIFSRRHSSDQKKKVFFLSEL